MRDFKAGRDVNVGRDLHINDHSNQPKPLDQYTKDELLAEWQNLKQRLSREKKGKIKFWTLVCGCAEVVLSSVALWYYMQGNTTFSSLLFSLGSVFLGLVALQYVVFDKNEVQQADIKQIGKINFILRQRGTK